MGTVRSTLTPRVSCLRARKATPHVKTAVGALLLVLGLGAAGCSGDDPDPSAEPTTASEVGAEPAASDGVITPADVPVIPAFAKTPKGVIGDVVVDSCDTEAGDVAASGTATNSAESARDVVVVVSWTVGDTGDVVARGIATLNELGAGESADWRLDATVPGADTAACVPMALAGRLESKDGRA